MGVDGPFNVRNVPGNEMPDRTDYVPNNSPLDQALLHLETAIATLDECAEVLFTRTEPVRFNRPLPGPIGNSKPEDPLGHSTVVSNIENKTEHLHELATRLQILIAQLEV